MKTNARVLWTIGVAGWVLAIGVAAALDAAAAPAKSEPVALVTEMTGTGSVAQKPDGGALEQLLELAPGAVVSLAGGARAVVVHTSTGTVYELAGPGRFRVQAKGIDALEGARLIRRELPAAIRSFQLKPLSTMQASVVMRGAAPVRLDGPNGGVLSAEELDYRIRGKLAAQSVEIIEADGKVSTSVRDASATFNAASAATLRPGNRYTVLVKGTDERGQRTELSSRFWLIDTDAAARLKAARPGADATLTDLIIYAMALESAGATASARATWDIINERR